MAGLNDFDELGRLKGIKIVHLNIRSIWKKIDQLRLLLQNSKIDIITISETWLSEKMNSSLLQIEGYQLFRHDRCYLTSSKKTGGGLITYVRDSKFVHVEVLSEACISNDNLEIQWLRIKNTNSKNILLGNMYRPPTGKVQLAIKSVDLGLQTLKKEREDVFLVGDFNIDYKNKRVLDYKKLQFFEKSNSLKQIIETSTRITKTTSSILDIVLTNTLHVSCSGVIDTSISDHQPIFVVRKKTRNQPSEMQKFKGRTYRNYNKEDFADRLTASNWTQFFEASNVNDAWQEMDRLITKVADETCPIINYTIRKYRPAWMSNELIEQTKDRDYFYRKAKKTNSEDDWNIARFHRNAANKNIRKAKADFVKDQLMTNANNSSKFWRTIKQVIPSNNAKPKSSNIALTGPDSLQIPSKDTADYINNFFVNVGKTTKTKTTNAVNPQDPLQVVQNNPQDPLQVDQNNLGNGDPMSDPNTDDVDPDPIFQFTKLRPQIVLKYIKLINTSKSSGMTHLSSRLIKDSMTALLLQITHLFNMSLEIGSFPTDWKKALVIPIPKKGKMTDVGNYRPISLLPLPGKVLEKLVHEQLSEHYEYNDYLSDNQFGFRQQRSTTHAIAQLLNQIYTNINKSAITAAVYIDFRKAFDCVQHDKLIQKIATQNIDAPAVCWIKDYLTNRQQRTYANDVYSSFQNITQGVPQGSVLGPLFYIIYADDIKRRIKKSSYTFYADDTVLYTNKKNLPTACKHLQNDLDNLLSWCDENGIYINTCKTKLMFYGSKTALNKSILPKVHIHGNELERVTKYSYLGVLMDEQLTFELHANSTISKVSNKMYQLKRMRPFLTRKAALLVYKNMILPILEYGDIVMDSASKLIKKRLQTLQNKALRCALEVDKATSSSVIHREAKLSKLKTRRKQHLLLHMYQVSHTSNFQLWKAQAAYSVHTRSSKKKMITLKKPNNEKYKKSISYQGPKQWNKLPTHLQKLDNYYDFKSQLQSHLHEPKPAI